MPGIGGKSTSKLESEIAFLEGQERRDSARLHKLKNKLYNQRCRDTREYLRAYGFTLKDAIDGKVEIDDLSEAAWFDRTVLICPGREISLHYWWMPEGDAREITSLSEIREIIDRDPILLERCPGLIGFERALLWPSYPFTYWGIRQTIGVKK